MKSIKVAPALCSALVLCVILSALALPFRLAAQQAPVNLGAAGNYVILSKTGITNVPPSPITGNIGASPITGAAIHVTCAEVTGTISAVDAAGPAPCSLIAPSPLGTAILDMQTAYTNAAGRTIPDFTELYAGNISGRTLVPGLYKWSTGVMVDGTGVTLSGGPNAVWIFQVAGDVVLANTAQVTLAGGARAANIFWQVGGPTAVTLGTGSRFYGTILSAKQVILNTGATLIGRALAMTQVTLQSTSVTTPGALVGGIPAVVAPAVTSAVPANSSTGAPIAGKLTAVFSEAMDPATITAATFTLQNGATPVAGAVSYAGSTATFSPSANLVAGTTYIATITVGAKDPAGVPLAANYSWTFVTGTTLDTTPPTVSSTVPASATTSFPIGNALTATFSEAMDPSTITSATFNLKQGGTSIPGSASYAGVTGTFRPTAGLTANTLYTAMVTTGAKDLAGNSLVNNYTWTFTTSSASGGADTTAPTLLSTVANNGATLVTITSDLVANFSEPMNPLTITTATFTLNQGTTLVPGAVTYTGASATFRPASPLAPNTLYSAAITSGAKDLAGNALAANYQWSFTTGASTGQTPVCLANFAVLAGSAIFGAGASVITGDLGVSPGVSVSGFPPGTLKGTVHAGDAAAARAIADLSAAYLDAVSRSVGPVSASGNIAGQTFTAGLYKSASSLDISSGQVILDAKGDVNAVFIFQIATSLTTAAGSQLLLAGGAQASNVFWQVGTTATLGSNSAFRGSILADQSITLNAGATVDGRLLARTGTVTLVSNIVTSPPPGLVAGGIFNAAGWSRAVAAGSIATVFGNNLASSVTSATTYPLLTTLGGTGFQVGTQGAPLFLTSCNQANLQIPWESAGQTQVQVTATAGGLVSAQEPATVAPFAPGIFTINMTGTGQGAVEIAPTALLASPTGPLGHPVQRGEYIAIFCTGLGAVSNQPATGAAALSSPLSFTSTSPLVTVGNVSAQVTFSGLVPGLAGLYQVNAVVPAAAPSGDAVNLVLTIGGVASNTVTIAIQ